MAKKKAKGKPPAKKSQCPAPKGGKKPVRGVGKKTTRTKSPTVSSAGSKSVKSATSKHTNSTAKKSSSTSKPSAKNKKAEGKKCPKKCATGAEKKKRLPRTSGSESVVAVRSRRRRKISLPDKLWYVVAVESNRDGSVKKSITRKKRIESMQKEIGKCIAPFDYVEQILPLAAEVVAEGQDIDSNNARKTGIIKAWKLAVAGETNPDYCDDRREPPGFRVRVHPGKSSTKGKVSNHWVWQVKRERTDGERKVLKRILKYPGYLILNMRMTTNAFHLVRDTRGVHYFLPSNDAPISLATEEAARVLIEQQVAVDKHKERNKVITLPFGVGSVVDIKAGVWRNNSGRVVKIDGPQNAPNVSINLTVMGVPVTVTIPYYEVLG